MSEINAWAKAFVKMQSELPEIAKDKKATIKTNSGSSFSYTYADLATIMGAVREKLAAHGFAVAQDVGFTNDGTFITIETRLYHESGEVQSFGPLALAGGNDARAAGSAITYGRRYALCAALGIVTDEDDDAHVATQTKKETTKAEVAQATSQTESTVDWLPEGITKAKALGAARKIQNGVTQLSQVTAENVPLVLERLGIGDWSTPKETVDA